MTSPCPPCALFFSYPVLPVEIFSRLPSEPDAPVSPVELLS